MDLLTDFLPGSVLFIPVSVEVGGRVVQLRMTADGDDKLLVHFGELLRLSMTSLRRTHQRQ